MDIFALEILVNYLESLSLAHSDDQARGTTATTTTTTTTTTITSLYVSKFTAQIQKP